LSSITVPFAVNDREFVASPLENGRALVDLAMHTVSINKPDDNVLMNGVRSLIFYGHGGLFLANDFSAGFGKNHGFGKRPTR
jgi:hypothetical protein